MRLTVKYFGQIAECTGRNSELLEAKGQSVSQLINQLNTKYPGLIDLAFTVAVDKNLVPQETVLTQDAEVALLPPFSGG